ncbi:MAG: hypothetical protein ACUVRD_07965 [Bacteroidia bacterium]
MRIRDEIVLIEKVFLEWGYVVTSGFPAGKVFLLYYAENLFFSFI